MFIIGNHIVESRRSAKEEPKQRTSGSRSSLIRLNMSSTGEIILRSVVQKFKVHAQSERESILEVARDVIQTVPPLNDKGAKVRPLEKIYQKTEQEITNVTMKRKRRLRKITRKTNQKN